MVVLNTQQQKQNARSQEPPSLDVDGFFPETTTDALPTPDDKTNGDLEWINKSVDGEERQPSQLEDEVPVLQKVENAKKQMDEHQKVLDELVK